jgi:hypothetical protein
VFWSATAFAAPAIAQVADEPQTRAELLRREREEKQRAAEPYQPTGLERAMDPAKTASCRSCSATASTPSSEV